MMIRSPFTVVKAKVNDPRHQERTNSSYAADPEEEDEIVSLDFDNLSSSSGSNPSQQNGHDKNDNNARHGSFYSSASSFSSSVSSSLHSSSSRFMDSMRQIKIIPRRMKPTLEMYNELPDESGGNSSAELALELDKIVMEGPENLTNGDPTQEEEPSDSQLITNLEAVMAMENSDYSICLDDHAPDLSPLSVDRPLVDLPPVSPTRRVSSSSTKATKGGKKLVPKDKAPQPPQRGLRRGQPLSALELRKKLDHRSVAARLHKSSPAYLNHTSSSPAEFQSDAYCTSVTRPRRSLIQKDVPDSSTSRSNKEQPDGGHRSNTRSPRRRFRHTQPNHCPAQQQQQLPSPNNVTTTPIATTLSRNRRRMSFLEAPDLNDIGRTGDDLVLVSSQNEPQHHFPRSKLFVRRPDGTTVQRSTDDPTDLGRITEKYLSSSKSGLNSSIGQLKTDFLVKSSKRERTKFNFDPKSLKDVMPSAVQTAATSEEKKDDLVKSNSVVVVNSHPLTGLKLPSFIGM